MPIKPCDHVRKLQRGVENYRQLGTGMTYAVMRAEVALEEAWKKDRAAHEENGPALAHNAAMRDRIIATMKAAGVPDSYRAPDPKSRAWPQKHKTFEAGYLGDIRRTFVTSDSFDDARRQYEDRAKLIAEAKKKVEEEKAAREREAEAALARRKADISLAGIIVRYQLPDGTDWPEALEALRKRDKYLDLAVAGLQTRGDWSDGFYRVEDALSRFKIESDRDKDIAADLCGCLRARDDGENDGRVFRDTKWSYDKLFEIVEDKQLVADARLCLEHDPQ